MVKKISSPRGTADILPADVSVWQSIENQSRELFKCYNYKEIRTPYFEETGLFQRSLGQTSDVVNKQLLQLAGDKKEGYSLRPEGTASVVRSYIENGMDRKESLSKYFYLGAMFRGERPQKGRLRQFHQIGAEAIGLNAQSPFLDAEIIGLAVQLLNRFGLKDFKLKINTLGTLEDKEAFSRVLREKLDDKRVELCEECQNRFNRNIFRVLDCKNNICSQIVGQLDIGDEHLSEESRIYFEEVKGALNSASIEYFVEPKLVRGLDYYTHTVFEITGSSLGSQDALGAGGRYGGLVKQLGGPEADAIGFALGIERIILAKNQAQDKQNDPLLDAFIVTFDNCGQKMAFQIVSELRKNGLVADMSFKTASIKKQMSQANKLNARTVVIVGEDEIKNNCVVLKDMATAVQEKIDINNDNFDLLIQKFKERK